MEIVKVGLVVMAGLGSTWVARAATDALLGVREPVATLVQAPDAQPVAGPAAADKPAPPAVPEMSHEEMEAELRRAQAELSGAKNTDELREFRPTRPLPADLPVALPSDI
jgi:hypothetical protein